jgi:hypothetical protein
VEGIKEEVVLSPAHALSLIASGEGTCFYLEDMLYIIQPKFLGYLCSRSPKEVEVGPKAVAAVAAVDDPWKLPVLEQNRAPGDGVPAGDEFWPTNRAAAVDGAAAGDGASTRRGGRPAADEAAAVEGMAAVDGGTHPRPAAAELGRRNPVSAAAPLLRCIWAASPASTGSRRQQARRRLRRALDLR